MIETPDPAPLDLPQGNTAGLEDVVEDVAGAAYWLSVLASDLAGPAASAPGWLGADAAAAAAQVGAVAGLARECSHAVGAAAHRLRLHHDLLVDVRRRVRALQEEQQDDFRSMWQRLSRIEDPQLAVMVDAPERVAAIEEVRAGEASRRRRHAALLEELAADAVATAGLLADSSRLVGGRGDRGDGERVLAHLAAELPGWGDQRLAARGVELAHLLMNESLTSVTVDDLVRRGVLLSGSPAFANALFDGLGEEGVALLLHSLGSNFLGGASPVAALLAAAFGAAVPGDGRNRVDEVLDATYVRADDRYGEASYIAAGMGLVMAAGATMPSGGPRPVTVAGWARQMLLREHEQKVLTGIGAVPADWPRGTSDPVALAIEILADRGDPQVTASLLGDASVWEGLMNRRWADGGVAIGAVVREAALDDTGAGARAVRTGLEVVGAGLFEGRPLDWAVSRSSVGTLAPALASAVARHVTVVTNVLGLGLDGQLDGRAGDLLRGLGYVTLHDEAAQTVGAAMQDWVRAQPLPADLGDGSAPLPAIVVPSAFLAVREYGQRLDYALDGFEAQSRAQWKEALWDVVVGIPTSIPTKLNPLADAAIGLAEGYAAMALGFDGRWDNGHDEGLHFDGDAAADAVRALVPADPAVAEQLAGQARTYFERTTEALGGPRPPTPPEFDAWAPVKEVAGDFVPNEIVERGVKSGWNRLDDALYRVGPGR
jgi:hypothetical protein